MNERLRKLALPLAAALVMTGTSALAQVREAASCQSDIVSSTVVSTRCSHREDSSEVLDVVILWRGSPGWFRPAGPGRRGMEGSSTVGQATKGHVIQRAIYGDVTIGFDADFDAGTITVGDRTLSLGEVNAIFVDRVTEPGPPQITGTRLTEARLPLAGDHNLILARRSRTVRDYLQCEIPMPAPPMGRVPQPQLPVVTVCDKLRAK